MGNLGFRFDGRTAMITGAARGIGRELAAAFIAAGADTYLLDMDEQALAETVGAIGGAPLVTDIASTESVQRAVSAAAEQSGRIDVLVNNAGVLRDNVLWKLSDDDWDTVVDVHLGGTFKMTRACVPVFRRQGSGRVVNVTSYSGLHGNLGQANYAAAKAGIIGFTRTAAKELARFGITVNAISPNAETRMVASIPEDRRAELAAGIPMGRFAAPSEMCAAVQFLASEEAGYVTGVVLPVDGGLSI
ncbi:MAG: SDR family oxidoreductase [Solirubrobacteraceae bacterium]